MNVCGFCKRRSIPTNSLGIYNVDGRPTSTSISVDDLRAKDIVLTAFASFKQSAPEHKLFAAVSPFITWHGRVGTTAAGCQ